MNRMVGNRGNEHLKPVKKIELSEKFPKRRLLAVIILALIGVTTLTYSLVSYFHVDSGWRTIETSSSAEANCSNEFSFQYLLGKSGMSATAEYKAIASLYTDLTVRAHQLFHNNQNFDNMQNLYYVNQHPNEIIEVDSVLYHAFETLQAYESRWIYFAPVYAEYANLFACNDDSETISFDPYQNKEVAAYFAEIADFANDSSMIELELLGENRIRLFISEEYFAYAKDIGFSCFIDFFSLKNAFIIDYLAEELISHNYTLGHITSYDGFLRNLDGSGEIYSYQLYDRVGQHVYPAAELVYQNAISIVSLRNYMLGNMDKQHYYELANSEIRTSYIDSSDGFCKSTVNNLTGYTYSKGCSDVALELMPIYAADTFDETVLSSLQDKGIYSIYGKDYVLYYNEASLLLSALYENEDITYHAQIVP